VTTDSENVGNRRAGYLIGASFLIVFGFGVGILLNIVAHLSAPPNGAQFFFVTIYPTWGLYATLTLILGIVATFVGLGMVWLGVNTPYGPLSLIDTEGKPKESPH
jgi:hypothetical protein